MLEHGNFSNRAHAKRERRACARRSGSTVIASTHTGGPVLQQHHITSSRGVGLTREQEELLRAVLGDEHRLVTHTGLHAALREKEPPFMLWLSSSGLRELAALPPKRRRELEETPKALLLEQDYTLDDFETACDLGINDIVRPPLTRERVMDIMRRTLEVRSIYTDIACMSREISVERELLERKNGILAFLVSFLTNATDSLNIEELLRGAFADLAKLLPVMSLHAALWENGDEGTATVDLFVAAPEGTPAHYAWKETLLEHAHRSSCPRSADLQTKALPLTDRTDGGDAMPPENDSLLCLPLVCGKERLGILLLQTDMERYLGRDQALALDSALRHFSLTLKNARRFRQLQMHADYDALTQVHSRRHFEHRMEEEMQRFARYGESLSMIMIDIDHFKAVNDTYGHHAGDQVLREVAGQLAASIRNTDYCARFGGEEFAVILPHTDGKKAHALAERMRKRIARHTVLTDNDTPMNVTVSMGVASLARGDKTDKHALLCNADAALYAAKSGGRNRTCDYEPPLPASPAALAVCRSAV